MLIADLPPQENEQFQLVNTACTPSSTRTTTASSSTTSACRRRTCCKPPQGDGLTIAYHGLNLGRVALCADGRRHDAADAGQHAPLGRVPPTYGEPIATRELVQRRLGRLAGLIVGCDALVAWCSSLIDQGYRGEMECIIAKIFGSEAQKEAAIELFMKTHGGRSFLHGHLFGDNVHEFLAPCIYEGEGEMLGMAFFKSLVKEHGKQFFEPIGKALAAAGMKTFSPVNPVHVWKLRKALVPYGRLVARREAGAASGGRELGPMPDAAARARRCSRFAACRRCRWRSAPRCASTSSSWPTASAG